MFSEINGQPLMQHGPYGAALLDFAPPAAVASTSANNSSSLSPFTPLHNPSHLPSNFFNQRERLLIQENLILRQSCQQLMVQVDQLNRKRDYLYTQFTTFHLLYVNQKQDRARLARQLTSTQRELEHLKRAQVLANSVALGHHPIESSTLPARRRAHHHPLNHHHHPNHHPHHQFNNNGHHNHHNLFYRSLKVTGSSRASAIGRGGGRRSWRRTQSAKYHGGSSTSTIDQEATTRPKLKVNVSKAASKGQGKSTYRRYDELNEEDHKTPVLSPSSVKNSPPVFPATAGQQQVWNETSINDRNSIMENHSNVFVDRQIQGQVMLPVMVDGVTLATVENYQQPCLYMHPNDTVDPQFEFLTDQKELKEQAIFCSSDDGEIDGSGSDGQERPPKRSTKLVYRDSLRQCVEFSRSLLDLSRRQVVGAEKDENEDDVDKYYQHCDDNTDTLQNTEQLLENKAVDERENSEQQSQQKSTCNTNDCSNLLTDFLLTYEALEQQKEKKTDNSTTLNVEQAIVPIEEAIPMIDASEPQCSQFLQIECAPITFTSSATAEPALQLPSSPSLFLNETSMTTNNNNNNNNLVVNLSYVSDDLPATYLREVRLPNKPARQFLGIFFESAFSSGVVVQQVVPGSVAARAGIGPGDRVLEICGINMRTANYRLASKVLAQCETDTVCFKIVSSEAAHRGFPVQHQQNYAAHLVQDGESNLQSGNYCEHPSTSTAGQSHSFNHAMSTSSNEHHHQLLLLCSQASTSSSGTTASTATGSSDSTGEIRDGDDRQLIATSSRLRKTCTLTRREAFKNKQRLHSYFERRHGKEAMLYQMTALTVELPRRITVTTPLAKIKLLGGNAVGIFVHSIGDELLSQLLRTGDQLLEYNNYDLTRATAEDAARELAKPASRNTGSNVLVAMFNLETYNQIQELPTGDSFYVRAQFSRTSRKNSLGFKKDDILYVDNTLYDGKPGQWRAWRVDEFGRKRSCGLIPSKYTAQCELMKQHWQQQQHNQNGPSGLFHHKHNGTTTSKWYHFKLFSFASSFRGILFWKGGKSGCSSGDGYTKLDDDGSQQYHPMIKSKKRDRRNGSDSSERILASCVVPSYSPLLISDSSESVMTHSNGEDHSILSSQASIERVSIANDDEAADVVDENVNVPSSYKLVDMLPLQATPRPVLIYGPFSHIIAARLETAFPELFRVCSRRNVPISLALSTSPDNVALDSSIEHCGATVALSSEGSNFNSSSAANLETLRCIALGDLADVAAEGRHAVISVLTNTVADFRAHSLFPIVVGLRFRSAKHIKETVNRWKLGEQLPLIPGSGGRAVGYKLAKTSYAHQLKLEHAFGGVTNVRVAGNNIAYMCTQIKDRVSEEQGKVVWKDAEA